MPRSIRSVNLALYRTSRSLGDLATSIGRVARGSDADEKAGEMQDFVFATRIFSDFDPSTGVECEIRDHMVRKPCGSFYLLEGPGVKADSREVVTAYSLEGVYEWLQDCPWQIERTVIVNSPRGNYPRI